MSKTTLQKSDIIHLAKLANLTLKDEEVEKYMKQLEETLDYVENLNTLDTSKTEETHSTANLINIFFEDGTKCTRMLTPEETVANAKEKKGKYFVVKRIM